MPAASENKNSMNLSLAELVKKHGGNWVALEPNTSKVLASGGDIKLVFRKAKKCGVKIPTMFKVPTELVSFIG